MFNKYIYSQRQFLNGHRNEWLNSFDPNQDYHSYVETLSYSRIKFAYQYALQLLAKRGLTVQDVKFYKKEDKEGLYHDCYCIFYYDTTQPNIECHYWIDVLKWSKHNFRYE